MTISDARFPAVPVVSLKAGEIQDYVPAALNPKLFNSTSKTGYIPCMSRVEPDQPSALSRSRELRFAERRAMARWGRALVCGPDSNEV